MADSISFSPGSCARRRYSDRNLSAPCPSSIQVGHELGAVDAAGGVEVFDPHVGRGLGGRAEHRGRAGHEGAHAELDFGRALAAAVWAVAAVARANRAVPHAMSVASDFTELSPVVSHC
jgi:hypothetical protein